MSAADSIRDFLAPLLPGYVLQFGRWTDTPATPRRYAVLRPVGGALVELVRRPQFSLLLIGERNTDATALNNTAEVVIEAMRSDAGDLVFLQPAEPVFAPTSDGRPTLEFAISAITN